MNPLFPHLDLLFSSTPLEGPEQMALDEVLLRHAARPLLRLYSWKAPCVTFGYFQKYNAVQAAFPGRELVRRWSGGGSVEHGNDVTFSLIVPTTEPTGKITPSLFYQHFHQRLVETLQTFGCAARLIGAEETIAGPSCFVAPSLHDVVFKNQKIAGGAQRRSAGALLHQGSLTRVPLQKPHPSMMTSSCFTALNQLNAQHSSHAENSGIIMEQGSRQNAPLWSSTSTFNSSQSTVRSSGLWGDSIIKSFFALFASKLSSTLSLLEEKEAWLAEAHQLATERYRQNTWTKKR